MDQLARFRKDQSGSAAIEYGLVAALSAGLLLAIYAQTHSFWFGRSFWQVIADSLN